jgi:hypothetical protein
VVCGAGGVAGGSGRWVDVVVAGGGGGWCVRSSTLGSLEIRQEIGTNNPNSLAARRRMEL